MAEKDSLENLTTDQLMQSTRLFQALLRNPDTRENVQRAIKKVDPTAVIPEIDAKDAVLKEVATEREARVKLENDIRERDIKDRIAKDRENVRGEFKLTEAQMLEVEKVMTDKDAPIPNYRAAAKVYLASQKAAEPTSAMIQPPVFEMPEANVWKQGIGNRAALDKIAIKEAYNAWNEITGRTPKAA